jgi:hypothetical protein
MLTIDAFFFRDLDRDACRIEHTSHRFVASSSRREGRDGVRSRIRRRRDHRSSRASPDAAHRA